MNIQNQFALITLATISFFSRTQAQPNFIFSENPKHSQVQIKKAAYGIPNRLLASKDLYGSSVGLDDGAFWQIEGIQSQQTVQTWLINDSLIIYPMYCTCKSNARFFIYNERTHTSAYAELKVAPLYGTAAHNCIQSFNYTYGELCTVNGLGQATNWLIDSNDWHKLQTWKHNQTIIIGYNEGGFARWLSNYSHILINVEKNDFIYAQAL